MVKKYKFGFDLWGLLLFVIIMIPNFFWFAVPAPEDFLRGESVTPIIDTIGSIFQVIFVVLICVIKRQDIDKIRFSKWIIAVLIMVGCYFIGWIVYYWGMVNPFIVALLTISPCLAFALYEIDRKNILALVPTAIFAICHIIFGFANYYSVYI